MVKGNNLSSCEKEALRQIKKIVGINTFNKNKNEYENRVKNGCNKGKSTYKILLNMESKKMGNFGEVYAKMIDRLEKKLAEAYFKTEYGGECVNPSGTIKRNKDCNEKWGDMVIKKSYKIDNPITLREAKRKFKLGMGGNHSLIWDQRIRKKMRTFKYNRPECFNKNGKFSVKKCKGILSDLYATAIHTADMELDKELNNRKCLRNLKELKPYLFTKNEYPILKRKYKELGQHCLNENKKTFKNIKEKIAEIKQSFPKRKKNNDLPDDPPILYKLFK